MGKSTTKISITVMLIILTLVLTPLLSSNVSALVVWSAGSGSSSSPPPAATLTMTPGGGSITDPAPFAGASVIFTFTYTFSDTGGPATAGSSHKVDMVVTPGGALWSTGWVYIGPGGSVGPLTLSSGTYTNVRGTTYTITVTMWVQDWNPPQNLIFATGVTTVTVN